MTNWEQRKAVGDAHEARVAGEFEQLGWDVAAWGQSVLTAPIREALSLSNSRWRYFPDLVAARQGDIVTIDGKDKMYSTQSDRYAISVKCVSFGLQFLAAFDIPLFYVFGNMGVLTPTEVKSYGTLGPRGRGGAYYLVPGRLAHPFGDVFGLPGQAQAA